MRFKKRNYSMADATMLIAASTIIDNAIKHKALLESKRSAWAGSFFDAQKADIDQAIRLYLGVDSAKQLRKATNKLKEQNKQARELLSEAKVQIEADFSANETRRDEILAELGYKTYYTKAARGSHEDVLELLTAFATNMDPELQVELVNAGLDTFTINTLLQLAEDFKATEVLQETLKGTKRELNAAGVATFNDIYQRVINISKIASRFLKSNPVLQREFNFSRIVKAQGLKLPPKEDPDTMPAQAV